MPTTRVQPPRLSGVSAVDRVVLVARRKAGGRERADKLLAGASSAFVNVFEPAGAEGAAQR
jgi:hypothetical protein